MSTENYSLSEPFPYLDEAGQPDSYGVYIIKNGLLTGEAGHGKTPEDATRDARRILSELRRCYE